MLFPLYRTALGTESVELEEMQQEPPQNPWALAIVGAQARLNLAQGQPVSHREIAVLASITVRSIRYFVRQGELTPITNKRPAMYSARQVRQWLKARGVPGLETRRHK